ncbi:hypothetical protein G6F24_017815 [Rhizopus arrhizus]|nr:hypothetical protein G6F24_017815 [Rhizopus arrhizus]
MPMASPARIRPSSGTPRRHPTSSPAPCWTPRSSSLPHPPVGPARTGANRTAARISAASAARPVGCNPPTTPPAPTANRTWLPSCSWIPDCPRPTAANGYGAAVAAITRSGARTAA